MICRKGCSCPFLSCETHNFNSTPAWAFLIAVTISKDTMVMWKLYEIKANFIWYEKYQKAKEKILYERNNSKRDVPGGIF